LACAPFVPRTAAQCPAGLRVGADALGGRLPLLSSISVEQSSGLSVSPGADARPRQELLEAARLVLDQHRDVRQRAVELLGRENAPDVELVLVSRRDVRALVGGDLGVDRRLRAVIENERKPLGLKARSWRRKS
jgi:hypothetical protein